MNAIFFSPCFSVRHSSIIFSLSSVAPKSGMLLLQANVLCQLHSVINRLIISCSDGQDGITLEENFTAYQDNDGETRCIR